MVTRGDLRQWIMEALKVYGGKASIVEICRFVWEHYESELKASGDLFYTWQYDIRWAATPMRHEGLLKPVKESPPGIWELK